MADRYIIEELTPEDLEKLEKSHPNTEAKFKLIETGYHPLNMGYYETREAAEKSKTEWIARDELTEEIEEFIDDMLTKYGSRLDPEEVKQMIKAD